MKRRFTGVALMVAGCVAGQSCAGELKMDFESSQYHETAVNGQDGWQDTLGIHKITADSALSGTQSLQINQPPAPNTADEYAKSGDEYAIRKLTAVGDLAQWSMLAKPTSAGLFHVRFDAGQGGPANVAGFYLDTRPTVRRASGTEGEPLGKEGDVVVGNTYRVTVTFDFDAQKCMVKIEGVGNSTSLTGTFPFARGAMTREQAAAGSLLFRNARLRGFDGKTLVDDITAGHTPQSSGSATK